ncbi:hypothetical protein ACWEJP_20955 [Streptomyces sp. NPDC004749]
MRCALLELSTIVGNIGGAILGFFIKWNLVAIFLRHWDRIKAGITSRAIGLVAYIGGLPGRIRSALGSVGSLLYSKGIDIVRGLWNGIKSMGGWLRGQLISFARSSIPGPVAKALGISSPSKVMAQSVGRWIPAGIVQGIQAGTPALDRTMAGLVSPPDGGIAGGGGGAFGSSGARSTAAGMTVRIELAGPAALKALIRQIVQTDGRGDVQVAFGR